MSAIGGIGYRHPYGAPRQPRFHPWITGPLQMVQPSAGLVCSLAELKQQRRRPTDDTTQDTTLTSYLYTAQRMCELEISGHRQFLTAVYNLPLSHWFWGNVLKIPRPPLQQVNAITYYDTTQTLQTLAATYYLVQENWRQPGQIERAPLQVFPPHMIDMQWPITIQFTAGYASPATMTGSTFTVPATTFTAGQVVTVSCSTDGTLPAPLLPDTNYYVVNVSGDAFQLAATSGGAAITLTAGTAAMLFVGTVPPTIRQAILLLAAHWDQNRELVGTVGDEIAMTVRSLLDAEGYGSYA